MRNQFSARSLPAVVAVASLALLSGVTGCASEKGAEAGAGAKTGGRVVGQQDLQGLEMHVVSDAEATTDAAAATAVEPACVPLAKAQAFWLPGSPVTKEWSKAVSKPLKPEASDEERLEAYGKGLADTTTRIALGSYEGNGAKEAFALLKTAADACAGGYTDDFPTTIGPGAAVTGGDEALSYEMRFEVVGDEGPGMKITTKLVVVRKGGTLAIFSAVNEIGVAEDPRAIVSVQLDKLG
ncbi:hypothetical protein OG625_15295 [Streptomyces sp. NBC_01351]|uniref:hypothetical protein n=1 Tax=Streptomyces sp. NBC_01351 TaxID=2903833 RepID=UPI002E34DE3C|nr:hypothetical protein [Streptomyces sp. NBC_01351]